MYTIKEIITDKFWIVESAQENVGTIRRVDDHYMFFNRITMQSKILTSLHQFQDAIDRKSVV